MSDETVVVAKNKLLEMFGGEEVVVRTSSYITDEDTATPLVYLGFLLDMDEEFVYIGPTYNRPTTAIRLESVDEITIYEEKPAEVHQLSDVNKPKKDDMN